MHYPCSPRENSPRAARGLATDTWAELSRWQSLPVRGSLSEHLHTSVTQPHSMLLLGCTKPQNSTALLLPKATVGRETHGTSQLDQGAKLRVGARPARSIFSQPLALRALGGEAEAPSPCCVFLPSPEQGKHFGMSTDTEQCDTIDTPLQTHQHVANTLERAGIIISERFL